MRRRNATDSTGVILNQDGRLDTLGQASKWRNVAESRTLCGWPLLG